MITSGIIAANLNLKLSTWIWIEKKKMRTMREKNGWVRAAILPYNIWKEVKIEKKHGTFMSIYIIVLIWFNSFTNYSWVDENHVRHQFTTFVRYWLLTTDLLLFILFDSFRIQMYFISKYRAFWFSCMWTLNIVYVEFILHPIIKWHK